MSHSVTQIEFAGVALGRLKVITGVQTHTKKKLTPNNTRTKIHTCIQMSLEIQRFPDNQIAGDLNDLTETKCGSTVLYKIYT